MLQHDLAMKFYKALVVDPDGNVLFNQIDVIHQTVHQGKMHTLSHTKLNVADNGFLRVRFVAPVDKDIHIRIAWASEGKSRLKTYVGTTYTANGTPIVPFNRKTALASNLQGTYFIDPTINVLGTLRGNDFLGTAGAAATRVGGTGAADIETIISAGTELLVEIQNVRGSASDLNLIANLYEREKF